MPHSINESDSDLLIPSVRGNDTRDPFTMFIHDYDKSNSVAQL